MTASTPPPLLSTDGVPGKDEFALDGTQRHLNHGSYGAVPVRTIAHQAALKQQLESNPFRWFEDLAPRHEAARGVLAPFVGAPVDELAMVPSASAGASVVFGSIPLRPGDEVLLTDHVYGAVAMGAERCARAGGAGLRVVHVPHSAGADETLTRILDGVTARTRMVVVDHVSSSTARAFPVRDLAAALAAHDVTIVVDGAHALGILPAAAVRAPNVVWVGNLHKYPCAPRGAAVLVAQGELAQRLFPLIDSWGAELAFPHRFDLQGSIDSTGFLSAPHAIGTLDSLFGWHRIRQHGATLGAWALSIVAPALAAHMHDDPVPDVGMPVAQQPLLRLPRGVASDARSARVLKDRLASDAGCEVGVSTWRGQGFIRISAHVYNDAADYEQLVERGVPVIAALRT